MSNINLYSINSSILIFFLYSVEKKLRC